MEQIFDETVKFSEPSYGACSGYCRMQAYRDSAHPDKLPVVIVSEIIDEDGGYVSVGVTVTEGINSIANYAHAKFGGFSMLIEHYPARGADFKERLEKGLSPEYPEESSIVTFERPHAGRQVVACSRYGRPHWEVIPRSRVVELLNGAYAEPEGGYHERAGKVLSAFV
ncbi:MAG TPA: hypothetical protein VH186_30095 [Chloroflexia bacterium]|nr:hypothetical protein [Chloroflexia bacterium]